MNKSALSRASGLPYTTIDGIFKKGCDNIKLSTLEKLCKAFGVSLDYLVLGEDFAITEHEKNIVLAYRQNILMRDAVDKLLGVSDSDVILAYRAACSEDSHPGEVVEVSDDVIEKLRSAPDTDDGLI